MELQRIQGKKFFIVGGAGFIGSHFTDELLFRRQVAGVTLFDNFSSGREWHYEAHLNDTRFRVVRGDVKDLKALKNAMQGHDVVIHLASNPDIARAANEPTIDFDEGTLLTNHVVEAMRCTSAKRILYAWAAEFMAIWARSKRRKTMARFCPLLLTVRASLREKP